MQRQKEIEKEFISMVQKHQGILNKICFVYAKNKSDKEDLYQEMLLQLWKSYPSFEQRAQFSTWMYRVALNTAITLTKKASLSGRHDNLARIEDQPEELSDYSEDIKILYRAIAELTKIEKAIILLWLEEKTYAEIADTIGLSEKNVSVKLVRIKKKLAETINRKN